MPSSFRPVWGISSELPSDIVPGRLYICTDTREILLDTESGDRISLNSLTELPGMLPIESGGTNASTKINARNNLGVPAELGIVPTDGLPFGYGIVVCRGGLGNTIGQSTALDNYYWGVDSDVVLWGGSQINGATEVTWVRAAMMNGELGFTKIWAGDLANGTIELPGARNYAALMVYGPPKGGEENVMSIVPAGSGIYVYHGGESSSFGYNIGTSNGHLAITITKNTEGGSIIGIYAMVRAKA